MPLQMLAMIEMCRSEYDYCVLLWPTQSLQGETYVLWQKCCSCLSLGSHKVRAFGVYGDLQRLKAAQLLPHYGDKVRPELHVLPELMWTKYSALLRLIHTGSKHKDRANSLRLCASIINGADWTHPVNTSLNINNHFYYCYNFWLLTSFCVLHHFTPFKPIRKKIMNPITCPSFYCCSFCWRPARFVE